MAKRKPKPKASTTTAPSVVPTAILGLVTRLCSNRDAAKLIVTHALIGTNSKSSLSRLMKNADRVLDAADKDQDVYDFDGALTIGLALSITAPPSHTPSPVPTSKSPHSPVRKSKKPYWIKVVSSYDPSQPNGYGLKGRFIDESDVRKLPSGTIFVVQTSHGKIANINVLTKSTGITAAIPFPAASTRPPLQIEDANPLSRPSNYSMLFSLLAGMGIPTTRKPIPF